MSKLPFLLCCLLFACIAFLGKAEAKEAECTMEVKIAASLGSIDNTNPVTVNILVKGYYTIQHKDETKPGPRQLVNTKVPYKVAGYTQATVPTIVIDNLRAKAIAKVTKALQDGLIKICEKNGCKNK